MKLTGISIDVSWQDEQDMEELRARVLAYRRLIVGCDHIDGWWQFEVVGAVWQCRACGHLTTEEGHQQHLSAPRKKEERDALGTALVDWRSPYVFG